MKVIASLGGGGARMSVPQQLMEELPVIPPDDEPSIEISGRGMAVRALGNLLYMIPAEARGSSHVTRKRSILRTRPTLFTIHLTRSAARAVIHLTDTHKATTKRAVMTAKPGYYGVSIREAHTFIFMSAIRDLFPTNGIQPPPHKR